MRTARLALLLAALPFSANALEGLRFQHEDWVLACDNTGTCRAAGYQSEESSTAPVSVLLERRAGANTQIKATVRLRVEQEAPHFVELHLGHQALGRIRLSYNGTGSLSPAQTRALIANLQGVTPFEFRSQEQTWTLSTLGANAVLLKMDEFQRRVDTPSALLASGKQRGNPLRAQAAPVIHAATVPEPPARTIAPEDADYNRLFRLLLDATQEQCNHPYVSEENKPELEAYRLSEHHALILLPCWMSAYNSGQVAVLMDNRLSQVFELVDTDFIDYGKGVLSSVHKDRGLGDCWSTKEYVWDGQRFVKSLEQSTGLCRGFDGGAWDLPTFVSDVRTRQ